MTLLLALLPLVAGCVAAGGLITYPIGVAAGRRAVAPRLRRRDVAEMDRMLAGLGPVAIGAGVPFTGRGRHRMTVRESLRRRWEATAPRDYPTPARPGRSTAAAGETVLVFTSAPFPPEVEVWRSLAPDWRERGTGPIPVVQVFTGHRELIGSAT